jgi:hypothetical protein
MKRRRDEARRLEALRHRKFRRPSLGRGPTRLRLGAVMPLDIWPARPLRAFGIRKTLVKIPRTFSFITHPNDALVTLETLRRIAGTRGVDSVTLDYSECEDLDLCASVVQDVLALRAKRQSGFRAGGIEFPGKFSKSDDVNLLLLTSGILKQLGHPISKALPKELTTRLRLFNLRIGKPGPLHLTSATELTATELADFFDGVLSTEHYRLRPEWKANLIELTTEVLDNAEQHSERDRSWYVIGKYKQSERPEDGGECHIVLFNFGDTIYESLSRADTSVELRRQIRDLASVHRNRQLFTRLAENVGLLTPLWEEESLWTLYALQEGVSRFNNQPGQTDRGNGTVKMLQFFTDLASADPQMALISGKTHILFDGTHRLREKHVGGESRKIIAFNETNDLHDRPDPRYVRTLRYHFPGTLVSLKFTIRNVDLAKVSGRLNVTG